MKRCPLCGETYRRAGPSVNPHDGAGWMLDKKFYPPHSENSIECLRRQVGNRGHIVTFDENGLASCKRCKGGEIELEESCAERLARQLIEERREKIELEKKLSRIRRGWTRILNIAKEIIK